MGDSSHLLSAGLSLALLSAGAACPASAQQEARADVVVVVDTSTSMTEQGMDPERSSLLVTKLLADIVPGDLAVVRLLDLKDDAADIPSRGTGIMEPCSEDPKTRCERVEPIGDWPATARTKRLGALVRPARGDAAYKQALEGHLEQRRHNSLFDLAFRAAQGIFDGHAAPVPTPRFAIWLSDGRPEDPAPLAQVLRELTAAGVDVEAVVFGQGDPAFARGAGLAVRQVSSPAEIMKAFAGAFRRMVQAPYELDGRIADAPGFEIKPQVDEAWIVVYGDDSLGEVGLDGPMGRVAADYAADRWAGAGAYRVAHLTHPTAGRWTVHAAGGGAGVAYAVVQRSLLAPFLVAPRTALAGMPANLVAGVRAGNTGPPITDPAVLSEMALTAEVQGQTLRLAAAAGGRFTAGVTFHGIGSVPVRLRLKSPLVDRTVNEAVEVSGHFNYSGGPLDIDLGTLGVAARACRPVGLHADHQGQIPFSLRALRSLPAGHTLTLQLPAGRLAPGGQPLAALPGTPFVVCLETSSTAPSSTAAGEPWLEVLAAGGATPAQRVTLRLRWTVHGLTFWQRWRWLFLWLAVLLLVAFVVGGYVVPQRFHGSFALTYVPERDELDEQSPQPVRQWRGVGIGFYRDARAYLHADYRLSGRPQGALAGLRAEAGGPRVMPGAGGALYREALDATWEPVPPEGRRARPGEIYRSGERGPFFRISNWRGRR